MTPPTHAKSARELEIGTDVMVELSGVNKWYGQFHVLKDIDLTVYRGERIVVCGPSGSGKSTMIRCINRLEEHQRGKIVVDGVELSHDLKHIEYVRHSIACPASSSASRCTGAPASTSSCSSISDSTACGFHAAIALRSSMTRSGVRTNPRGDSLSRCPGQHPRPR